MTKLMTIKDILERAIQMRASDVHLFCGCVPIFRIHGDLQPSDLPEINEVHLTTLIDELLNEKQKDIFREKKDIDFSFSFGSGYHFRFNLHMGESKPAATIRILSQHISTREELMLPTIIDSLAMRRQGLIVVSGTAGCGKSTTLTYMVNLINQKRKCKIITIEDPIEYHHSPIKSHILQREVGADTPSFSSALKYALRQDPDVVVIGEMRDLESVSMALTTAETGHLVITTVHAPDAIETINRIVDVYPSGHREQIFIQLSRNLLGIVSQMLIPGKEAARILATEILLGNVAAQNLIRRGALVELRGQMDGESEKGMYSLEKCLCDYLFRDIISEHTAREFAHYPHTLEHFIKMYYTRTKRSSEKSDMKGLPIVDDVAKQKILIIDPHDHSRVAIVLRLRQQGFINVSYAENGQKGYILAMAEKPDIIVLDVSIADQDACELCKKIKKDPQITAKVILVGNLITRVLQKSAESAGADYLVEDIFALPFLKDENT